MYDSSDTGEQMQAIAAYKQLLNKSDPLEPGRHWLRTDRDTLYRRVIQHEVLNAENEAKAGEWAIQAIEDGFTKLRFQDERVKAFWEKTLRSFKRDNKQDKNKDQSADQDPQINSSNKPSDEDAAPAQDGSVSPKGGDSAPEQQEKRGKFDVLPGLDDVRLDREQSDLSITLVG